MKLPPINSRMRKILMTMIESGPLSIKTGIELHGDFRVSMDAVVDMYEQLVTLGCARRTEVCYQATAAARLRLDPGAVDAVPEVAGLPVPPRSAPAFKPLAKRHIPDVRGQRDGSDDWRKIPSRYAQLDKDGGK